MQSIGISFEIIPADLRLSRHFVPHNDKSAAQHNSCLPCVKGGGCVADGGIVTREELCSVAILPPSDEGGGPPKVVEGEIECAAGTPYFFTITSYLLHKKAPIRVLFYVTRGATVVIPNDFLYCSGVV